MTFTWLTHAACDTPAERCPIGRSSQHRGSYYMPWHQFDVSSASCRRVEGSGRRRRGCSLMCSRSTGAVTISRQRTKMLCCLVRTLLSPALCDHHGRAPLTHGGLCVSSAARANEFWTAVWDWTCVFGPPKPRKRVTWRRRPRLNPEVFKQTNKQKKKVAHGSVPAPHTLKLAS